MPPVQSSRVASRTSGIPIRIRTFFPACLICLCSSGQELGIPAMRSHRRLTVPCNMSPLRHNLSHPLYWFKGQVIARWAAKAEAGGVLMPDGRVYTPGYDGGGIASLPEIVERIEWSAVRKAVELVVHPATSS